MPEPESRLTVFAKITPKPEFLDQARQAIINIIPATRQEEGCRTFTLHEADGDLYLFEVWDTAGALELHYAQPYTKDVFAAYRDWLAKPVEITKMLPVML